MSGKTRHTPMRMCGVCRLRAPKATLKRFVRMGDELVPDETHTASGRGLYLCEAPRCGEAFFRRHAKRNAKGQ